ncbi:MAG: PIN domain-containing protein, partial [Kiritimatiellae bacterium]|nr:PIN domain-containing protein [Kiritimatiellia bacterium]
VRIWQRLSAAGNRIPTNDIWIAAHALELGATLVTTDPHFKAIPLLDVLYPD